MLNAKILLVTFLLCASAQADQGYSDLSKVLSNVAHGSIESTKAGEEKSAQLRFQTFNLDDEGKVPVAFALKTDSATSQQLWQWNPRKFLSGKKDLLDDVRDFYAKQVYLEDYALNSHPYPYLNTWGQLFHPPVRSLDLTPSEVFAPFGKVNSFHNRQFLSPSVQTHLDILTGHELTSGNKTTLLQNKDSFDEKLSLVKNARHSIFISQLALACDPSSQPMISALTAAVQKKLDVRILVDHMYATIAKSCVQSFAKAGMKVIVVQNPDSKFKIMATTNHTSMWIIDQEIVIIGAQNLAEANNVSTGFNFKDRDTDLKIEGPVATDALQEYIAVWNENSAKKDQSLVAYTLDLNRKLKEEHAAGLRGQEHYAQWASQSKGLCRIAFQRPNRLQTGVSNLLIESIKVAKDLIEITTTQTKLDEKNKSNLINTIAELLEQKSKKTSTRIDLIGNGIDGADGELTMALDGMVNKQFQKGHFILGKTLDYFNDHDAYSKASDNHDVQLALSNPNFKTYQHFNFYHGKQWYFDRTALLVGSMNFDAKSFENHYEGAAMCFDADLNANFEENLLVDLVNSVPVTH